MRIETRLFSTGRHVKGSLSLFHEKRRKWPSPVTVTACTIRSKGSFFSCQMPKVIKIPIQNKISLQIVINADTYTVVQNTSRSLIDSIGRKNRVDRIRITFLMRIWVQLSGSGSCSFIRVMLNCGHWYTDLLGLHFQRPRAATPI